MGIIGNSVDNQGNIEVDTAGTAIYSNGGTVNLQSGDITLKGGSTNNETKGVVLNGSNQTLNRAGGNLNLEDYSYAFVNTGSGNTLNLAGSDVVLKNNSIYAYSNDVNSNIYNNVNLKFDGTEGGNLGIYSNGIVENYANIDLTKGYGNIGIYSYGQRAKNTGIISVGASDTAKCLGIPLVYVLNCSGVKLDEQEKVYANRRGGGTPFFRNAELQQLGIPVIVGI